MSSLNSCLNSLNNNELDGITYDSISHLLWTKYENPFGKINDVAYIDTNKMFIAGSPDILFFNGQSFNVLEKSKFHKESYVVAMSNEQNVYFGSSVYDQFNIEKGLMFYWTGYSLISFEIPKDNTGKIIDIFKDKNFPFDVWVNTEKINLIYKFQDNFFKEYYIDEGYEGGFTFKDSSERIITVKFNRNIPIPKYKIYKYDVATDKFLSLLEGSLENSNISNIGKDLILQKEDHVFIFKNNSWVYSTNTALALNQSEYLNLLHSDGIYGVILFTYQKFLPNGMYNYISKKWHYENRLNSIIADRNLIIGEGIKYKGTSVLFYHNYSSTNKSAIYIGKFPNIYN